MAEVTNRLTRDQMDRVLGDHFLHERNRDVDGVLGTLTEDAAHEVVGDPAGVLFGRAACRTRYEDVYRNLTVERVDVNHRLHGEDFVVEDETWHGTVEGTFLGFEGRGRALSMRMLHIFEFRDGLISRETLWIDSASVVAQLG